MKPVPTQGADGSPHHEFEKTMDKPPEQYTANESVPERGDAGLDGTSEVPEQENADSLAKRFV